MADQNGMRVVKEIISSSTYAALATCDSDRPRVRPVSAFLQDDGAVLVAAYAGSRKMKEIEANPRVKLCFVDGRHWQVRAPGKAELVTDVGVKAALMEHELTPKMWKEYLSGPDDPRFGVIRIVPERFEWSKSGEVTYHVLQL